MKNYEKADQYLTEALEMVGDDENMKGAILSYLGLLKSQTSRFPEAMILLEESVQLAERDSNVPALTKRLGDLGAIYINSAVELLHRAVSVLSMGRQFAQSTNRMRELAKQSNSLGVCFYYLNQSAISLKLLNEARNIFEVHDSPSKKQIDNLIRHIEEKEDFPFVPQHHDLFRTLYVLVDNAAMGDTISKDIVLPILHEMSGSMDEKISNFGNCLQKYVEGEKDFEKIIDGISPEHQINIILSTIRLEGLEKALFFKELLTKVSKYIDSEDNDAHPIQELINKIEYFIATGGEELQGIDNYLNLIVKGERDSAILTSGIPNKRYRMLLSIFTTTLSQID